MSEWKEIELGLFVDILSSKRIFAADYVPKGIPFFRSKEVIERALGQEISNPLYITEKRFQDIKSKFGSPVDGDILLSAVGERAGIPYLVNNEGDFYFKDGNLIWFRKFSNELDSEYLVYFLKSRIGQFQLENLMIGSAQKALTIVGLKGLVISVPNINQQKQIAKTLSNIDQKITLLRQQNQTLEELAQTLFKRWFVEFNFTDSQGKPYKDNGGKMIESELGEIPEGWRVGELYELLEKIVDNRGKTPPLVMEKNFLMLETYQMSSRTTFPKFDNDIKKKFVAEETYYNWFRAGHPQYLDILFATVGNGIPNWCFMPKNDNQFCIAQNLVAIRAKKEIGGVYLKYFFDTNYFIHTCKGIIITTAQPSIKLAHLKQLDVLIPSQNLIRKYSDLVLPMVNQISNNSEEIQTLTQLRDTLLPKLMSGKLRVNV
jgi:type I restriction enzyme S subunit